MQNIYSGIIYIHIYIYIDSRGEIFKLYLRYIVSLIRPRHQSEQKAFQDHFVY